jgi:hypothetical protein
MEASGPGWQVGTEVGMEAQGLDCQVGMEAQGLDCQVGMEDGKNNGH